MLRQALRRLGKSPGTSALAAFVFALGLALTSTAWSYAYGVLWRGLPFDDASELMSLASSEPAQGRFNLRVEAAEFFEWRDAQRSFEGLHALLVRTVSLADDVAFPERTDGCRITHGAFEDLGVVPHLGRFFTAEDDLPRAAPVVVIGWGLWQERFQGDPGVLDRTLRVDGESARVVGVLPPGFKFPFRQKLWLPLRLERGQPAEGKAALRVFGRLRDGVRPEAAQAEMTAIAARLAERDPTTHAGRGVVVRPFHEVAVAPGYARVTLLILGVAGLVLLLACANVTSLLLARALGRQRDLAIMGALGAGRRRLMGDLLAESLVLALSGVVLGLVLTWLGVRHVAAELVAFNLPFWMEVSFDVRVVAFSLGAAVSAAVVAGLYPAWRASRADVALLLQETRQPAAASVGRVVRVLVTAEVALAFVLVVTTGLVARSLVQLTRIDLGVDPERVITARIGLPPDVYPEPARRVDFVDRLLAGVGANAGVAAVSATTHLPLEGIGNVVPVEVEGADYPTPADRPRAHRIAVADGFFELFDIDVLGGRTFSSLDLEGGRPVAVVNRSFAELAWPGQDPVDRRLRLDGDPEASWRTVVGVVADAWVDTLGEPLTAGVYLPYAQTGETAVEVVALAGGDASDLATVLRREVRALDASLPVDVLRLSEMLDFETLLFEFYGRPIVVLGFIALLFAAAGILGVNLFSVYRRTSEIGVRMALGAERRDVLLLFLAEGAWRFLAGLALGLVLAFQVTPLLARALYEVEARDVLVFAAAAFFLGLVAFLATLVPAWRAARTEVVEALRHT